MIFHNIIIESLDLRIDSTEEGNQVKLNQKLMTIDNNN